MSENFELTLGSWFSCGWDTFKKNPKTIIAGAVILSVFYFILTLLTSFVPVVGSLIAFLCHFSVGPVLIVGWSFFCFRLVRGDSDVEVLDIFGAFSRFGASWATFILLCLIVMGGFILFVVPGIIWTLKYWMSLFAVMDKQMSPQEALRFSAKITKGHKGKLFVLFTVAILLSFLTWPFSFGLQTQSAMLIGIGFILYLVHILVITPWLGAATAAAYKSLAYKREELER